MYVVGAEEQAWYRTPGDMHMFLSDHWHMSGTVCAGTVKLASFYQLSKDARSGGKPPTTPKGSKKRKADAAAGAGGSAGTDGEKQQQERPPAPSPAKVQGAEHLLSLGNSAAPSGSSTGQDGAGSDAAGELGTATPVPSRGPPNFSAPLTVGEGAVVRMKLKRVPGMGEEGQGDPWAVSPGSGERGAGSGERAATPMPSPGHGSPSPLPTTTTTEREKSAEEGEEKKSAEEGEEKQSAEDGEEEEKEGEGSGETGAEGDRETGGQKMDVDKGAAVDEGAAPDEAQSAADEYGDGEKAVPIPQSQISERLREFHAAQLRIATPGLALGVGENVENPTSIPPIPSDGPTRGTATGPMPTTGEAAQAETKEQAETKAREQEEEEGGYEVLAAYVPVADSPTSPDYSSDTLAAMGASME